MTHDTWSAGRLVELDDEECWELLRSHAVGRIAWSTGVTPHLVPVNYVAHEGRIWIRSTPYSALARECRGTMVAFEVDEIDDFTRSGASVVVEGVARPGDLHRVEAPAELESWAAGSRTFILAIEAQTVSGRRVMPH